MAAMTDWFENKFVDWFFRAQALGVTGTTAGAGTGPTALFVALFTATPTDSAAGTEVTGGSYARVSVTSALANWAGTQSAGSTTVSSGTGGRTSNNAAVTFPAPTADWGTVVGIAIFDAITSGNMLYYGTLTASRVVSNGNPAPSFAAGTLQIEVA